jgi:hypothetical protein
MNTSQRPGSSGPGGFLEALRGRWQIAPGLAGSRCPLATTSRGAGALVTQCEHGSGP